MLFSILALCLVLSNAFKYHLTEVLTLPNQASTLTERHGSSNINIDVEVMVYVKKNTTAKVAIAIFSLIDDKDNSKSYVDMCTGSDDVRNNKWAKREFNKRSPTVYQRFAKNVSLPEHHIFGDYYVWKSTFVRYYVVTVEGFYKVAIQTCPVDPNDFRFATIEGSISFRNPYGYLPGGLYGMLPFEGARMFAFFIFGSFFVFLCWRYRESVLPLNYAIMTVVLLATVESATWFGAYEQLNSTGEPYCCPFPSVVIAALVLQILRQTFSRTLLLVVCLGFGIVRPKLMSAEWVSVSIVTVLYLVTAVIAAVASIVTATDIHGNDEKKTLLSYDTPAMLMDIIFLSWIYLSLTSTIRILTEFQQSYKLQMYQSLAWVIGVFVCLFAGVAILIILYDNDVIDWPWRLIWVQQVLWEVLNFTVLAAVCVICRPSDHSKLLAFASQLPTSDPDEENDDDNMNTNNRSNFPGPGRPEEFDDDDDSHINSSSSNTNSKDLKVQNPSTVDNRGGGIAMVERKGHVIAVTGNRTSRQVSTTSSTAVSTSYNSSSNRNDKNGREKAMNSFTELPAADDDDEYGLGKFDETRL